VRLLVQSGEFGLRLLETNTVRQAPHYTSEKGHLGTLEEVSVSQRSQRQPDIWPIPALMTSEVRWRDADDGTYGLANAHGSAYHVRTLIEASSPQIVAGHRRAGATRLACGAIAAFAERPLVIPIRYAVAVCLGLSKRMRAARHSRCWTAVERLLARNRRGANMERHGPLH
jgi:hypothetical protein